MIAIFDLDQTLIDSKSANSFRKNNDWNQVMKMIPEFFVYDHINDILSFLKYKQVPVAVVSSSPSHYCRRVINHFHFPINFVVGYYDTIPNKPSPKPINLALDHFNALRTFKKNILVSDEAVDIIASKRYNVITIGSGWDSINKQELQSAKPDLYFEKTHELLDFIFQYFQDFPQGFKEIRH